MKNIKFSRLFAAFAFVAVLVLTACQQQPSSKSVAVEGTWVNDYEKYVITSDSFQSYWGKDVGCEMSIDEIEEVSDTAGILYGILTIGSDWTPKDTYYAVAYKELTDKSVKLSAAPESFKTMDEVKKAYNKLDAFAVYSDLVKEEEKAK